MDCYSISRSLFRVLFKILFRWEIHGSEHLQTKGGCLVCSNHASFLDPPLVGSPWPRPLHYFARESLFRFPFLRWWMEKCNAMSVRRDEVDLTALRKAIRLVESGEALVVFPEGTRTLDGNLQSAKNGAGLMAYKTKARIVPTYIDGSFRAWPKGRKWPRLTKIRVYYGEPFVPTELYGKPGSAETYQEITNLIMTKIGELKP